MRKELSKLIEANIIFSIKNSSWVANLVPIRKKNGEIRLWIDFRDLNQASLKDHHHLPSMEKYYLRLVVQRGSHFLMDSLVTIKHWSKSLIDTRLHSPPNGAPMLIVKFLLG